MRASLLLGLVALAASTVYGESPLVTFRYAMRPEMEVEPPAFSVFFSRYKSEKLMRLYEDDYWDYVRLRNRAAEDYEAFLSDLAGRHIIVSENGFHTLRTVTLRPVEVLKSAIDPKNGNRIDLQTWMATPNRIAGLASVAFNELIAAVEKYPHLTPEQVAFKRDLIAADSAFRRLVSGDLDTVEDERTLYRFLVKYG